MRIKVPKDLHHLFKKTDKWKSLRTSDKALAERRYFASSFIADWQAKFDVARSGEPQTAYEKAIGKNRQAYRSAERDTASYSAKHDAWYDPAFAHEYPDQHNVEQVVADTSLALARKRVKEIDKLMATGRIDPVEGHEEREALAHIIGGTVPSDTKKQTAMPLLSVVAEKFLASEKARIKLITYQKKPRHLKAFSSSLGTNR